MQVGPKTEPIKDEVLDFDTVMTRMDSFMDWLATQYVTALNIIHAFSILNHPFQCQPAKI
ncbi:MAG: pyruvate formate lyase family protein [Leptotrichia hofstadii]